MVSTAWFGTSALEPLPEFASSICGASVTIKGHRACECGITKTGDARAYAHRRQDDNASLCRAAKVIVTVIRSDFISSPEERTVLARLVLLVLLAAFLFAHALSLCDGKLRAVRSLNSVYHPNSPSP